MNPYLKHLKKVEFVITYACTGRCRHCSEGDHAGRGVSIDPSVAAQLVRTVASAFPIETVMTFGGEPLLYPEAVFAILSAATELGVPGRQVITNGYFTKDPRELCRVVQGLSAAGVNDLLLSVDAFHQETIPAEGVLFFAQEARRMGIPLRLQPAWLVGPKHDNPYNRRTRELLEFFAAEGFSENEGNVIFPEGNARKYLSDYFSAQIPENPYVEDPYDLRCLSVEPDGHLLNGNLYDCDIMELLEKYNPSEVEGYV